MTLLSATSNLARICSISLNGEFRGAKKNDALPPFARRKARHKIDENVERRMSIFGSVKFSFTFSRWR